MSRTFFSLSAVARRIEDYLRPALGRSFWVKAEISSGRQRRGSFYCDLVETDADGEVRAQLRCTIWPPELERMRRSLESADLELELGDGTLVGLQCQLQYHPRHGLSLKGLDMDPGVALGELELRRRKIVAALRRDGLVGKNERLPVPLLPTRIGLVASRGSAAYRDVVETLLDSGFGLRVYAADCVVQGAGARRSVLEGLRACRRVGVELVLLVRGGGSRSDLAALDDEVVAREIAAADCPVWTGIGHETDTSVLDVVAGRAFRTPTAAAEALVARFSKVELRLEQASQRLRSLWKLRHGAQARFLSHAVTGMRQGSRKLLAMRRSELRAGAETIRARANGRLAREGQRLGQWSARCGSLAVARLRQERLGGSALRDRLTRAGREALRGRGRALELQRRRLRPRRFLRRLEGESRTLEQRARALRSADPERALARGFSLVFNSSGALIRSIDDVRAGQTTVTRLTDGQLESVVHKTLESDDG